MEFSRKINRNFDSFQWCQLTTMFEVINYVMIRWFPRIKIHKLTVNKSVVVQCGFVWRFSENFQVFSGKFSRSNWRLVLRLLFVALLCSGLPGQNIDLGMGRGRAHSRQGPHLIRKDESIMSTISLWENTLKGYLKIYETFMLLWNVPRINGTSAKWHNSL